MGIATAALSSYLAMTDEGRLPQQAYLALRRAIRDLRLAPGQTVLEREIAEALGMSRTPVREALVRLETEGWVRLMPRHGFVVTALAPDDLRHMYEVVEGLEGLAAALAATRAAPEALAELDRAIDAQADVLAADDLPTWADLDDRFHARIVQLAANPRLSGTMDNYHDQLYRARLFTINLRPKPLRSLDEHRAVVAAMRVGDADASRALVQAHRRRARAEILQAVHALSPAAR